MKKNKEVVEYLLLHGATPNVSDHGKKTPLHTVTRARRHEYVEILCQHGARADMKDSSGQTALHVAAASDMTGTGTMNFKPFSFNHVNYILLCQNASGQILLEHGNLF